MGSFLPNCNRKGVNKQCFYETQVERFCLPRGACPLSNGFAMMEGGETHCSSFLCCLEAESSPKKLICVKLMGKKNVSGRRTHVPGTARAHCSHCLRESPGPGSGQSSELQSQQEQLQRNGKTVSELESSLLQTFPFPLLSVGVFLWKQSLCFSRGSWFASSSLGNEQEPQPRFNKGLFACKCS